MKNFMVIPLVLLLAGCRADVASPPATGDEPFVCPPKRRCLFDTTSGTWKILPDTCASGADIIVSLAATEQYGR